MLNVKDEGSTILPNAGNYLTNSALHNISEESTFLI